MKVVGSRSLTQRDAWDWETAGCSNSMEEISHAVGLLSFKICMSSKLSCRREKWMLVICGGKEEEADKGMDIVMRW